MPADLVGGGYQLYNPIWSFFGRLANATQSNVAVRSNLEYIGAGAKQEQSGTVTSEKGLLVAVPVTWGDIISNVWVATTTASESGAEFIGAVYEGVASNATTANETKVIAQSAVVKEEFKASKGNKLALKSSVLITPSNAPAGFVYAGLYVKETTATVQVACIKQKKEFQFYGGTAKEALGPFLSLTEASTASFASAKSGFKVEESKVSEIVPIVWLT
jgi:hypothetical protein